MIFLKMKISATNDANMNVMRKLLGSTGGSGGGSGDSGGGDELGGPTSPNQVEPDLLGLNHLRKMYQVIMLFLILTGAR